VRLILRLSHGLIFENDWTIGRMPAARRWRALRSRSCCLRRMVRWRFEKSYPPIVRMRHAVRSASVRRRYAPRSSALYKGRPRDDASTSAAASETVRSPRPIRHATFTRLVAGFR